RNLVIAYQSLCLPIGRYFVQVFLYTTQESMSQRRLTEGCRTRKCSPRQSDGRSKATSFGPIVILTAVTSIALPKRIIRTTRNVLRFLTGPLSNCLGRSIPLISFMRTTGRRRLQLPFCRHRLRA